VRRETPGYEPLIEEGAPLIVREAVMIDYRPCPALVLSAGVHTMRRNTRLALLSVYSVR